MKCADLSTAELVALVDRHNREFGDDDSLSRWDEVLSDRERELGLLRGQYAGTCLVWDVERAFPEFPRKVVRAKLDKLVRKGLLDGCACGCRGDFQATARGREVAGLLV